MYLEDAEAFEHRRELVAIEDDRRRNGVWGAGWIPKSGRHTDWIEEGDEDADLLPGRTGGDDDR